MYSSRFRFLLNGISRIKMSYKSHRSVVIQNVFKRSNIMPCTLGFSIFTWLGFDKKMSAEDELILTIKHCVLFIQRTEYEKAEQLLHVALRQAQQINHQLGITYIYDVMANLALQREQLDKAKKLFIAVTQRVMGDGAKQDDPRVVHINIKLARISHLKKEYETAQMGFEWCLGQLQNIIERDPSLDNTKLLAIAEDWYGRLFLESNKKEQGLNLMIESLNLMKKISDIEIEHIVMQLNDIGTAYDQIGKLDESMAYLTEALELSKELSDNEYLGIIYINLGRVYIKKKLLTEARKHCGKGWKIGITSKNNEVTKEAEMCLKEINNFQ